MNLPFLMSLIPTKKSSTIAIFTFALFFMNSGLSPSEGNFNQIRLIANAGSTMRIANRESAVVSGSPNPSINIQADFVFLIDGTDSMGEEINEVKNGLSVLVEKLNEAGIDARFAVVVYGGDPELVLDFTTSIEITKSAFEKINVWGAVDGFQNNHDVDPEAALEAVRTVLAEGTKVLAHSCVGGDGILDFRPAARKNLILLTDEDSDQPFHPDNRQAGQNHMEPPDDISETGWQLEVDETAQTVITNRAFINILLKPGDRPSISQFGDPQCDVSDADLLNFDPQATLSALEGKDAGNSLEAQVLKAGLIGRTFDIDSVDDPGFITKFFAAKIEEIKSVGSGTIKVDFEKGAEKEASKNVEIIMDASNSMWGQIGGEAKITIARKVLAQIINGLPDSMNVGMRVYGHRYGLNDKLACTDTQLLVPIGPVAKAQLVDTVNKIQLKGKTPLVLSVLEAIKDFEKIPNGSVILVTDGIESCNGDIKSIGPAIKKSGLELKVHIVGFDIKEKEARAELEAIAKSTEGRYLDAKNAGELLSALEQTLKLEYVVLDEKGEEAGRGVVGGDEVKLKEGTYTLRVQLAPQPIEIKVTIKPGATETRTLKKTQDKWTLN